MERCNKEDAHIYFKGENFMTPKVLEYFTDGEGNFCELSTGISFEDSEMFGCTFSGKDLNMNDNKFNRVFFNKKDALRYIGSVKICK